MRQTSTMSAENQINTAAGEGQILLAKKAEHDCRRWKTKEWLSMTVTGERRVS